MKVVILGGTKGMGRSVARQMIARGDAVALLGRNLEEVQRSAADLEIRAGDGRKVAAIECDLSAPEGFDAALEQADTALQGFDTVVVTAGLFGTQAQLEDDTMQAIELLRVNFAHTVGFCEAARKRLATRGGGTLCVFSSVAGDRGRKPVVLYGASKAGLSAYLEGLDHKFRAEGLRTVCVKPGFVKTGMTAGLTPPPFAGEADEVARRVIKAIDRGTPVVYAPGIWRWVMFVIARLPRFVMRRIGF